MSESVNLGRELPFVTEDVAEIRALLDEHDLSGHAHRAPDYTVIAQQSEVLYGNDAKVERAVACDSSKKIGGQVTARLVTY